MDKVKGTVIAVISALMSWLGILAIPVFLLVGCNTVDYTTGIIAAKYREEPINSYKGIKGIIKKVCMWLLVLIGAWIDILINYAVEVAGVDFTIPFVVATIVAVWLVVNEIISILERFFEHGSRFFYIHRNFHIKRNTEQLIHCCCYEKVLADIFQRIFDVICNTCQSDAAQNLVFLFECHIIIVPFSCKFWINRC